MRNPQRIDIILEILRRFWKKNPDLRLGQLVEIVAAMAKVKSIFFMEDDVFLCSLKKLKDDMEEKENNKSVIL